MKKVKKWLNDLLDKDSSVSSKRLVLILLALEFIYGSSFYVVSIQLGGVESVTTTDILKGVLYAIVGLVGVGGGAEALKQYKQKDNGDDQPK